MPYSEEVRQLPESLRKLTLNNKMCALLRSRFYSQAHPVVEQMTTIAGYPPQLLLAVLLIERVYGSQEATLTEVSDPDRWELLSEEFRTAVNDPLVRIPSVPPKAKAMDTFFNRLIAKGSGFLQQFQEIQLTTAIEVAQACGNFPLDAGQLPHNLTDFDRRFVVHGDGTYIAPYSDVRMIIDPETGEVTLQGSRAKDVKNARIQKVVTDAALDGKQGTRGLNHISVSTYTPYGPVILTTGQTAGAEVKETIRLLEQVHQQLGERFVWLVWDRAISGHYIDEVFEEFGAILVNKEYRDGSRGTTSLISDEEAKERYEKQQPLPVGMSVFPTTKGSEVIRSRNQRIGYHYDRDCRHMLWLDAGALHLVRDSEQARQQLRQTDSVGQGSLVDRLDLTPVKIAPVLASTATRTHNGQNWTLHTTWEYPCPNNPNITHRLDYDHCPAQPAHIRPGTLHHQLHRVRTIPRIDPRFPAIHGRRNVTESIQNSLKRTIGTGIHDGRALRLDEAKQQFQHLAGSVLITAITEIRQVKMES